MERLGMLRGVRMASVGAFVLIRQLLRLICGRRFALITVAMAIVVAYQLTDDLFISYGTVGADSLLGVDLPPLFMAAMTMGGSEAFALLLPLALLADSTWSFKNGYLSLLVAKGVDPVRLSLSCMAALMIATMLSFAVVALVTGAVCALVCSGSFETGLIRRGRSRNRRRLRAGMQRLVRNGAHQHGGHRLRADALVGRCGCACVPCALEPVARCPAAAGARCCSHGIIPGVRVLRLLRCAGAGCAQLRCCLHCCHGGPRVLVRVCLRFVHTWGKRSAWRGSSNFAAGLLASHRSRARRGSGGGRYVLRYALPAAERVVYRLASMAPSVVARMASCPARHDAFGCAVCVDAGNALRPTCRAVSARRALSHCHAVASWLWVQQRRARRCAAPAAWFRSLGYRVGRYRYGLRRVGACEYDSKLSAALAFRGVLLGSSTKRLRVRG